MEIKPTNKTLAVESKNDLNTKEIKQQTVFVGLSGGVDSAVAAATLQAEGYRVVGVFIKVWHPDFMVCNWEQERLDAMRVAAHLEIPFLTCDAETEYRDEVAQEFISEYKQGRTPNPDVLCNQEVKFGAFLKFARAKGADCIATGHYVRKVQTDKGEKMCRGVDEGKDQTYFLWSLTSDQLSFAKFPVGEFTKDEVRLKANALNLPVANKKDSQGICFLGHVDIPEFLSHYIDLEVGEVLNTNGEIIGEHKGSFVYTLGQRHGFTLRTADDARTPYFVIAKDVEHNTITVDTKTPKIKASDTVKLTKTVLRSSLEKNDVMEAQFRYRQKPFMVRVVDIDDAVVTIKPELSADMPASGQSCVLYRGDECIGGGVVSA